jgi:hypothetical protein
MTLVEFFIYLAGYVGFGFLFARFGLRTRSGPLTNWQALKIAVPSGVAMTLLTLFLGSNS